MLLAQFFLQLTPHWRLQYQTKKHQLKCNTRHPQKALVLTVIKRMKQNNSVSYTLYNWSVLQIVHVYNCSSTYNLYLNKLLHISFFKFLQLLLVHQLVLIQLPLVCSSAISVINEHDVMWQWTSPSRGERGRDRMTRCCMSTDSNRIL